MQLFKRFAIPGKTPSERVATFLATGFWTGMAAPIAPGTLGSWPGVLLALLFAAVLPVWAQAIACLALTLLAIPVCDIAERALGKKDDGRICADEWMLYPIATLGLPLVEAPWLIPPTFLVIRAIDILKPPPARGLQRIPGGLGIVVDDLVANLYALGANWMLYRATLAIL